MVGAARAAGRKASPAAHASGEGQRTCSFDDFVAFAKWWAPLRSVVAWLGAAWRGGAQQASRGSGHAGGSPAGLLVHGFLTRAAANALLQGRAPGTFLLRFSESKPGKLVIAFNDRPRPLSLDLPLPLDLPQDGSNPQAGDHGRDQPPGPASAAAAAALAAAPAPAALVTYHCLVDVRGGCCAITFEEGLRQEYPTLASLVLDCRRLECVEPDVPKAHAFRSHVPAGNGSSHSGTGPWGMPAPTPQPRPEPLSDFVATPAGGHEPQSQ
jgi:hypothetical protein